LLRTYILFKHLITGVNFLCRHAASVCLCVCLSVCYVCELCQNELTYHQKNFTIGFLRRSSFPCQTV